MKRVMAPMLLLAIATSLSGCVVAAYPSHPGWCYYHPYRCP